MDRAGPGQPLFFQGDSGGRNNHYSFSPAKTLSCELILMKEKAEKGNLLINSDPIRFTHFLIFCLSFSILNLIEAKLFRQ